MANDDNLKGHGFNEITAERQREIAKKGGKASAETRKKRKDIRLAIESLLEREYKGKGGESLSGAEAIAIKQMEKALRGDTKAFEVIRDTSGQKPVEKVMVAEVSQDVINEVERMVLGDE